MLRVTGTERVLGAPRAFSAAYFATHACVREKLRGTSPESVLVSCGKLSLGRLHKRTGFSLRIFFGISN